MNTLLTLAGAFYLSLVTISFVLMVINHIIESRFK